MELDSESNLITFVGSPQDLQRDSHQSAEQGNFILGFLHQRVLQPIFRYYMYVGWVVLIIFTILPFFTYSLRPFWLLICWVAPTLLAVEVNAGNRTWVYVSKSVIWFLQTSLAQYMLWVTDGFRNRSDLKRFGIPLTAILFLASCICTVVGNRQKKYISIRNDIDVNNPIARAVKKQTSLKPMDKTIYARFKQGQVYSRLSMDELEQAWVSATDIETGRRTLTKEEVNRHVVWTSFMTQYVVSRVFKDVHNRVFVYSPVAQYRTILITAALAVAGVVHIVRKMFEIDKNEEVVTSMILWLTLPAITLPSMVRIKFGNHATLLYLWGGFLPVVTDLQMWKRLGIAAQDLYAALTNAFSAERVLKDKVGVTEGYGVGTVKVLDTSEATGLCIKSLIRIGGNYVRVSDGTRFAFFKPRELRNLSESYVRFPLYRRSCESQTDGSLVSLRGGSSSSSATQVSTPMEPEVETGQQFEYSLAPDTRILRNLSP